MVVDDAVQNDMPMMAATTNAGMAIFRVFMMEEVSRDDFCELAEELGVTLCESASRGCNGESI